MEHVFSRSLGAWNSRQLGINFQILVNDVEQLYERVVSQNIPVFANLETSWYRIDQREFLMQDPDGYLLRFSEDIGDRPVR